MVFQDYTKTYKLIFQQLKSGKYGFLNLVEDHKVMFEDGLSPRKKNFYSENEIIHSTRNIQNKGKHRFSFVDRVWIDIIKEVKNDKINVEKFQKLKSRLFDNTNEYHIAPITLFVIITCLYLKINDYALYLNPEGECVLQLIKDDITQKDNLVDLTKIIQNILFPLGKSISVKNERMQNFVYDLYFHIDQYRNQLGLEPISGDIIFKNDMGFFRHAVNLEMFNQLKDRPLAKLIKNADVVYLDQDNDLFSIEIKCYRNINASDIRKNISSAQTPIVTNFNDLVKAIGNEMQMTKKFRK